MNGGFDSRIYLIQSNQQPDTNVNCILSAESRILIFEMDIDIKVPHFTLPHFRLDFSV